MFRKLGRFPGVLYREPDPASGFQRLTGAIAERWPEASPYGGVFEQVIPHLTVPHDQNKDVMHEIEVRLHDWLPVQARLIEAALFVFDGARWQFENDRRSTLTALAEHRLRQG